MAWDLLVDRGDLSQTEVAETPTPEPAPGQVLLRVDRVGVTANNVTYGIFGDAMRYWDFFPVAESDGRPRGRVPLWGFAEVERSTVDAVAEGTRLYGFLPTSSHLLVEPGPADARGLIDASAHRRDLPPVYNAMAATAADPTYRAETEDLQILFRPLFMTSFVLADFLADNGAFGADTVVLSSASSKTAYGTAFLLDGVHRVGLTSEANRAFTEAIGCYDEVRTYDEIDELSEAPAVYVDFSGDGTVRRRVHERLHPVHSAVVGATHYGAAPDEGFGPVPGAVPTLFFAPDQVAKRTEDWGADGLNERHGEAWGRFAPAVADWVDVSVGRGADGLRDAWLDNLAGTVAPSVGRIVELDRP